MNTAPYRCARCRHLISKGANVVPYGNTWVDEVELEECNLGWDAGVCDCPPGTEEPDDPHARCYGQLKWETYDDGDRAYDLWVEDRA